MKTSKPITQYLGRFAEISPEVDRIAALGPYREAVVVPLCGEDALVDGLLESLVAAAEQLDAPVLGILVVNQDDRTGLEHRQANQALLDRLPALGRLSHSFSIAVLDRTQGLGQCGVGTARKIGSDLALTLHARGVLQSAWIHTTDADARVAQDYFDLRPSAGTPWGLGPLPAGAFVHPFEHAQDGELGPALRLYDDFLRYYAQGLARAGSPYAYPTIGSTLSFSAEAYAQVRGFPKKDAAEDFYFLHKLAKVAFVWEGGGTVHLVARPSNRVPFGTGQSIARIRQLVLSGQPYAVYHPGVFDELESWYRAMDCLSEGTDWAEATAGLSPVLRECLDRMGATQAQQVSLSQHRGPEARLRHWHTWFDGFRILKLVHALRDAAYPNRPLPSIGAQFLGGGHHGLEGLLSGFHGKPL